MMLNFSRAPAGTRVGDPALIPFGFIPQGTGGPAPPPPSSTGQFTVSGGWVSLTFVEFFSDVSYTDAPITKRTN